MIARPPSDSLSLSERFARTGFACQSHVAEHPMFWLIGGLLLLRMLFIFFAPLDLIADESYYWDWSRRLDYGYYSKPPMIAWINWLSTSALGANEFAVRFPAALLGTLGLIFVYHLGAKLFSFRVGLYSVVLLALTPGQTALSFLMTIDAPFLFCWVAALHAFWMMTSEKTPSLKWCLLTALWLGLGVLSKQTMLAFLPLGGLFLLTARHRRPLLCSWRVWGTAAAALLFLLPVLHWNYRHDWITLEHTASHFQEQSPTWFAQATQVLEFLLGQIGVVSPVLWVAVMITLIAGFRSFLRLNDAEKYLLCFSGIPLLGVLLLSLTQPLEPNWPAACYPAGVILTTATLSGRSSLGDLFRNRAQLLAWSWKTGLVCSLLTYAAITIVPVTPLAGSSVDLTARLRGWKQLAVQFHELQAQHLSDTAAPQPLVITTAGRDITSALAFYLPDQPQIPLWSSSEHVQCQYDLWERPDLSQHAEVWLVTDPQQTPENLPEALRQAVPQWKPLGKIAVQLGHNRTREYQIYQSSFEEESLLQPAVHTAHKPIEQPTQDLKIQ